MTSRGAGSKTVSERIKRQNQHKVVAKPHELTYMSTPDEGCHKAGLNLYDIFLYPKQKAWRYLFATPELAEWFENVLPGIALSDDVEEDSLLTQVGIEFYSFRYGHELREPHDIRLLAPLDHSVWELKSPSLRLFGWFPEKNYFVVHVAEEKRKLSSWADYQPFIDEVVRFRESVVGFLPSHIKSGRLWDVVSNRPRSV